MSLDTPTQQPFGSAPQPTAWAAQVHGAYKIYGSGENEVRALNGVTVGFEAGRFTAIMGPSGSGKSTLMQCAAGLDRLTGGQAFIGDVDISTLEREGADAAASRQDRLHLPAVQPAADADRPRRTSPSRSTLAGRKPDAAWMDHVVTHRRSGDRLHHKPSELSGGQQQRVAVARALVERPEIIFADEPTGNLDSHSSAEILTFLRRSGRASSARRVVMVTHDPVAAAYASRVLFLADGRIVDELMAPDPRLGPRPHAPARRLRPTCSDTHSRACGPTSPA